MNTPDREAADASCYDPTHDIQLQALRHVDELVNDESHEAMAARLWALFWATTARLRYRGVPRAVFAQAFEDGCRAAELALQADLDEAQERLEEGCQTPAGLTQLEAPRRLM